MKGKHHSEPSIKKDFLSRQCKRQTADCRLQTVDQG